MPQNTIFSRRTDHDSDDIFDSLYPGWDGQPAAVIDRYWDGRDARDEKGLSWNNLTQVRSLWNQDALFFFFECWFDHLNVGPGAPGCRVPGLWEKDVAEVFLMPEGSSGYFEVEVNPLGQWLDVHIVQPRVDVRFNWQSGLTARVELKSEKRLWQAFLRLPFEPIIAAAQVSARPGAGDAWRANLFRVAGVEPAREYLAWQPTYVLDFHVPSAFGSLIFLP